MKIYIFNENCTMAGREVPQDRIDNHDDPDNDCDWTCFEGSPEELLEIAEAWTGCPNSLYRNRVATLIRTEVYRFHPELEPAESEEVE